jgi:hypothetical protein
VQDKDGIRVNNRRRGNRNRIRQGNNRMVEDKTAENNKRPAEDDEN